VIGLINVLFNKKLLANRIERQQLKIKIAFPLSLKERGAGGGV